MRLDSQIAQALNIVENCGSSSCCLARIWHRGEIASSRRRIQKANVCQYKKQQAIRKLADSLPDSDSLRDHLWHLMGMNAPAVIDGAVQVTALPGAFNVSLVDAA